MKRNPKLEREVVRHIGIMRALCDRRKHASLREDLGVERYRILGIKERFKGEAPYRICPACIKRVVSWKWMLKHGGTMKRPPRQVPVKWMR